MPTTPASLNADMTMRELLEAYPGAQRALFRKYHIGGCSSCGFRPDETLAQVCERNQGISVEEAIDYLHASKGEDEKMQISPAELAQKLHGEEAAADIRLVDIRTREEFDAARIEGAELFTQELMQQMLMKWDRATLVVFVDHQGRRSMDAAAYFAGHGFEHARSLRGGVDAWSAEVDPNVPRYHLE